MKTIALRFGETFSPSCGTIAAHQKIIEEKGHVWYGKLGSIIKQETIDGMMQLKDPMFLLISSGKDERYWVHFDDVKKDTPSASEFPSYYGNKAVRMGIWFRVTSFEPAPKNVMSRCFVISSGNPLSIASKRSINPCFIIDFKEDEQ